MLQLFGDILMVVGVIIILCGVLYMFIATPPDISSVEEKRI